MTHVNDLLKTLEPWVIVGYQYRKDLGDPSCIGYELYTTYKIKMELVVPESRPPGGCVTRADLTLTIPGAKIQEVLNWIQTNIDAQKSQK